MPGYRGELYTQPLKACNLKLDSFEGPLDLLFHLVEKNKVNIFDINISEITEQYMDYLFAMQELDMEIASEFVVVAATLLQIKSRILIPVKQAEAEVADPETELVLRLQEFVRYKKFTDTLREQGSNWENAFYRFPDIPFVKPEFIKPDIEPSKLAEVYVKLVRKTVDRQNPSSTRIEQIVKIEKVSLREKMKDIIKILTGKLRITFGELFPIYSKSRTEVVTGFLAMLELVKHKRIKIDQKRHFSDIIISKGEYYH